MCLFSIAKYLLFAFNFILWAAGAAVLGIGIYLAVGDGSSAVVEIGGVNFYASGSYILIAAGSFALIIGFLGCCGAMKESTCLLGLYFTCLLVIFILEVGVGIWALVNYDTVDELISESIYSYDLDPVSAESGGNSAFISMEKQFQCCGKNNSCNDWYAVKATEPYGCDCKEGDKNCEPISANSKCSVPTTNPTNYAYVYSEDCTTAMTVFVQDNLTLIAGIGLGIGLAEIFGMIFAMCLCGAIKDKRQVTP
uniref:tetraspanin-2-like isoform X1 n=1 Tax=Styela clava TaxID=7725 RepID=UPI0019392BCF|nr:tetraspanin-2-like isoform X1 [Styela clava]